MTTPDASLPATREIALRLLPPCHCRQSPSGNWPARPEEDWLQVKPEATEGQEPGLVEYECLHCHRRYRLRDKKLCEVMADGLERAYMREGRYGRWLSCR